MNLYFSHISPYDLASLGSLFTGMTVALLLAFSKTPRKIANLFLSSALTVILLKTSGLTTTFLPALGPLVYFYVRQLTDPDQRFHWKDLLHFSPLLAGYWIPTWLAFTWVIFYLYLSHRLIQNFYERLRPVLMDKPRFAFRRLEQLLLLLGLLCLLSILNDIFRFTIAFVLIGMAAEALLKPVSEVNLAIPVPDRSDAKEKGRRLREAVAVGRFYEDAELTLATLAVKLAIHPHEVSRIINVGLKKNFSDFINEFRVREVARKMQDPAYDKLTLLGIAYESGFNSKTTFNRVFREMTGKTPVEYKSNLNKEVPIDKLAPPPRIWLVILRPESPPTWAHETPKRKIMIRNYLKIAYRQMRKQKMYTAIKIGGLALGIAACLLIALYIHNELSYDKSYPDSNRIFRVVMVYTDKGTVGKAPEWPAPLAKALKANFPQIELSGRLRPVTGGVEVRRTDQTENSYEEGITFADQGMLDILKVPMVYGDRTHALAGPFTMVISRKKADKYFPGQNPVGKVMCFNNDKAHPYTVSAVMENFPATSHLQYDFLVTLTGKEMWTGEQNDWGSFNYPTYILIKNGTDAKDFGQKMTAGMIKNYFLPNIKKGGAKNPEQEAAKIHMVLQPLTDINLYSYDIRDGLSHGDIRAIWLFGGIAAFILIIACINFVNLATAKSANRAREVGLRKVIGSYRSALIKQFLIESMLYSYLSFIIGLLVAWLLLPYFNALASKSLIMPWGTWWLFPVILVSAFVVGIIAGLYPAFYLSGFKPIQVLKGTLSTGSRGSILRNSLVVFQFTASILLIIGTTVIYNQIHYILNQKVGFDKDHVVVLQGTSTLDKNVQSFKNELSKLAQVKSVSISDYLPVAGTNTNGNPFFIDGRSKLDAPIDGQFWQIDDTYLKTLGMKLVEGRNFSYDMSADTAGKTVIINQTLAKRLNLKKPIGARITNGTTFTVIGVVEDFNFESMHEQIAPLALHFGISPSLISIKISGTDVKGALQSITATWKQFAPDQPIRYTFLDDSFAKMYADVQRVGDIFSTFAVLAIVIACLGLFALSAFMAEQRSKEIGIRKVLGASVQGITTLLSMDFIKLVLLAILIASPIAWWAMNKWLQDFAYKIAISWWMFAVAGLGAILIALMTVSFQSIKAALANPVKSLKAE